MKNLFYTALSFIILIQTVNASEEQNKPHIMPDADGKYYQRLLVESTDKSSKLTQSDSIELIIKFGERNLNWLEYINKFREKKLSFSTPGNRRGHSTDSPSIYNESTILARYTKILVDLPIEMKEVLLGEQEFTDTPPIKESKYLEFGLKVDYIYQAAARFKLVMPHIEYYKQARAKDIRGYYNLEKLEDKKDKLKNYADLTKSEQTDIKSWLIGMCYNTKKDDAVCKADLDTDIKSNTSDLNIFYTKYSNKSKQIYKEYFEIPSNAKRKDINWHNTEELRTVHVPFKNNLSQEVKDFLHNIELEWQINKWKLVLDYSDADNIPYILFKPGVTPHVDKLGGNEITMDSNAPLTEWDVQWTIRHEYGHVLGLPDCYVEFYDESIESFVNYQIDVDNLMCSRRGKVFASHFEELAKSEV